MDTALRPPLLAENHRRRRDVVQIGIGPAPSAGRFGREPYLGRLQDTSAEAARLREALDILPLATLIIDRREIDSLRASFISQAAATLLGIEDPQGQAASGDLALAFGTTAEPVIRGIRELTSTREIFATVTAEQGNRRVRIVMTVLEADLGDSVLCTLTVERSPSAR